MHKSVITAAIVVAGLSTSAFADSNGITVGVSWSDFQEERWKTDEAAMLGALEAAGATYLSADAQSSATKQLADVESLITQGADALLVLNKADLLGDATAAAALAALLAPYRALGYRVIETSRATAAETLGAALAGHTSVLVGQSGVGKTSLVNALLPGLDRRTGELSGPGRKGRHTTTTVERSKRLVS